MLRLTVPSVELFDESKNSFSMTKSYELQLEHSLLSISKWESRWCVPFLATKSFTDEQTLDYIRCMTIGPNRNTIDYKMIPVSVRNEILDYIKAPMTATTFKKDEKATDKEIVTAEIIYYWMICFQIPFEWEKRHLNQLLALINVCNIKSKAEKKLTPKEQRAEMARRKALNEQRRAKLNTKG